MIDLKNHDYIISIKYINSVGETILFMLLVFKVIILYKWCQYNDLNDNIIIGIIETSYANNDIALN